MSFIYGIHPVMEALKSGKEVEKILIQQGLKGEGFRQIHALVREMEIPAQFVPIEKLNRLTRKNHQGVIAYLSEITYQKIENIIPYLFEQGKTPLILVLDRITDVRNFGAIARTSECAGVDAIVLPSRGSALVTADAVKTSAGALYKLPVCRTDNLEEAVMYLKNSGLKIIAAIEKADREYTEAGFSQPAALVMGSEETGISGDLLAMADEKIRIPMMGEIASLNVSVAAGILLYEAVRQRKSMR